MLGPAMFWGQRQRKQFLVSVNLDLEPEQDIGCLAVKLDGDTGS